jgi:hypothetical protein
MSECADPHCWGWILWVVLGPSVVGGAAVDKIEAGLGNPGRLVVFSVGHISCSFHFSYVGGDAPQICSDQF